MVCSPKLPEIWQNDITGHYKYYFDVQSEWGWGLKVILEKKFHLRYTISVFYQRKACDCSADAIKTLGS